MSSRHIPEFRDWLFDADRDLELQDFDSYHGLHDGLDDRVSAIKSALQGFNGRVSIHGPVEGLEITNLDPEIGPLISSRLVRAIDAADRVGARTMVLHSPFSHWYETNRYRSANYEQAVIDRVHKILGPVVAHAKATGVTLVLENVLDVRPETRRRLVESFETDAVAVSLDTGHAHLARFMSGGPSVEDFVRDAGDQLRHVHLQDNEGIADRHWAPGDGTIEWEAVFRALSDCASAPHLVLEMRRAVDILRGFKHLKSLGVAA